MVSPVRLRPDLIGLVGSLQLRGEVRRVRDLNDRVYAQAEILTDGAPDELSDYLGAWGGVESHTDLTLRMVLERQATNASAISVLNRLGDDLFAQLIEIENGIVRKKAGAEVPVESDSSETIGGLGARLRPPSWKHFRERVTNELNRLQSRAGREASRFSSRIQNGLNKFDNVPRKWKKWVKPLVKIILGIALIILSFFAEVVFNILNVITFGALTFLEVPVALLSAQLYEMGVSLIIEGIQDAIVVAQKDMLKNTVDRLNKLYARIGEAIVKLRLEAIAPLLVTLRDQIAQLYAKSTTAPPAKKQALLDQAVALTRQVDNVEAGVAEGQLDSRQAATILVTLREDARSSLKTPGGSGIFKWASSFFSAPTLAEAL